MDALNDNTIGYSTIMTVNDTRPVSMALYDNDSYSVFFRGNFSNVVNFTTTRMSIPAPPPPATLVESTGGALHIQLYSPGDTGEIYVKFLMHALH